jgi:hypothetical protein
MRSGKSCQFPNLVNGRLPNIPSTLSRNGSQGSSSLLSTVPPQNETAIAPSALYPSEVGIVAWDDLELLHHYLTVTSTTLASRNDLRQMWQIQIPKMALKQKLLMHSLLGVTALHIASSRPESQSSYIERAIRHHNIALREYSCQLHSMTRENSASLFVCATLIVIFALNLAMSRPQEEPMGPMEEILGIFTLLRGVPFVLGETWSWIRESEVEPMFRGREVDDTIILADDIANSVALLEERNQLSSNEYSDADTYARAIQELKVYFKLLSSKDLDRDHGMVLSWPISVGREYIALLGSRQQMALVILAHYAVILHEIRDTWWAIGWGRKLIQEVCQVVDIEWKSLIAWPMDKILTGR